jgi:hypothetical protein
LTISTKTLAATVVAVTVPAHDETIPSVVAYDSPLPATFPKPIADSWTPSTALSRTSFGGAFVEEVVADSLSRTYTGLVIGREYTLTINMNGDSTDVAYTLAVTGGSATRSFQLDQANVWLEEGITFTATSTSETVEFTRPTGDTSTLYWNRHTLTQDSYTEHVPDQYGPVDLDPEGGTATLDEGWAPYGKATLTIPIPPLATTLDALDPRQNPYVTITATQSTWTNGTGWSDPVTRELELLVRGRTVDHNAETVTLTLATQEAILQDAKLVATAPDYSLLPYQSSVRTICATVLARRGLALQAGDTDADFTTLTSVTNMIDNPSVTGGFDLRAVNCTMDANDTSWFTHGTNSVNAYGPTNADSYIEIGPTLAAGNFAFGMEPGKTYTLSADVRVKAAGTGTDLVGPVDRARALVIHTIDPTGSYLDGYDVYVSENLPNTVGATARLSLTVTLKTTATAIAIRLYNGNSSTQQVQFDGIMLVEGDGKETDGISLIEYFDGSTAATPNYTYAWEDVANQSASTRTPRFDRTPDALTQQPGTSDWDLLEPILQQSGLRLFADELGAWRLVDDTYHVPGRVTVSAGFNAYQAQDTISRDQAAADGSPLWFDSCVIKYSWIDADGVQQQAWDAYAPEGATMPAYFERSYAYPGPGTAEYYVKRVNGHGRTLSLTAAVDFTATPGMEASSSLPGTEDQTGYVSSVSWDFLADEMTVGTRGLIDTPASAWIQLPIGEQWLDSPSGASWTSEVV